jgi:hypothetical protein
MMIELRITWDEETGNVNVNGPVHNKGLCYLMLECARDAIKDHIDTIQQTDSNGLKPLILKAKRKR